MKAKSSKMTCFSGTLREKTKCSSSLFSDFENEGCTSINITISCSHSGFNDFESWIRPQTTSPVYCRRFVVAGLGSKIKLEESVVKGDIGEKVNSPKTQDFNTQQIVQ